MIARRCILGILNIISIADRELMSDAVRFRLQGVLLAAGRGGSNNGNGRRPDDPDDTEVRIAVQLDANRGGGTDVDIEARPGQDVVELELADGPRLILHPETAAELLAAGQGGVRSAVAADGALIVPPRLVWPILDPDDGGVGASRGVIGSVVIKAIRVLAGKLIDAAVENAAEKAAAALDARVIPGVYALTRDSVLVAGDPAQSALAALPPSSGAPILVLIHGTFSSTQGSFADLWQNAAQSTRDQLFSHYAEQVYSLEHATLTVSPLENALALAQALPQHARVHLLTHSRGGLVAEALVRASVDDAGSELSAFTSQQAEQVRTLQAILRDRRIVIERVVRVACPARGTLLVSGRLDVYLSVTSWLLEKAGLAPLSGLLDLLHTVARLRTDPERFPGIEAMTPDSALIAWLHSAGTPAAGDLRVVAGNRLGGSLLGWIKTLVADAFFWTDNDFVVQTRSMYGGVARASGASFLLASNTTVSHFGYFVDQAIAPQLADLLIASKTALPNIGPQSAAGLSGDGIRGLTGRAAVATGDRPVVVVMGGVLSTGLDHAGRPIWGGQALPNDLERLAMPDLPVTARLHPEVFSGLVAFLRASHEVFDGSVDWRQSLCVQAQTLAAQLRELLATCHAARQPLRVLAHSSGGLVLRALAQREPELWARLLDQANAYIVLLGVPQQGWWVPLSLCAGIDPLSPRIQAFAAPGRGGAIRRGLAGCPGLLETQAKLDDAGEPGQPIDWNVLAQEHLEARKALDPWHHGGPVTERSVKRLAERDGWGLPSEAVWAAVREVQRELASQVVDGADLFRGRARIVVGHAALTPAGYQRDDRGFALQGHAEGDGRVSWDSALWPDAPAWQVEADHEGLPGFEAAWPGYVELLSTGETRVLKRLPRARKPAPLRRMPRQDVLAGGALPAEVLGRAPGSAAPALPVETLKVAVRHGDLRFLREPLMLGHYSALRLTGSERVIDRLIGGTLQAALVLGRYPDQAGQAQVFINSRVADDDVSRLPRPSGVIVVGLGPEGKLTPEALVRSVRQGVIAWAQRVLEAEGRSVSRFDLAAVPIGSGGSGMSGGQSAQLILRGVLEANQLLRSIRAGESPSDGVALADACWPSVRRLVVTELYLDRAADALRALKIQGDASGDAVIVESVVECGGGGLERPLESGYRGAQYDLISAVDSYDAERRLIINYTLDTRRARSELKAQTTQLPLIELLIRAGSNQAVRDPDIGRTLFKLLIPVEIEPYLAGGQELQIELTQATAAIPWELLDAGFQPEGRQRHQPWSIRCKLLRKLRIEDYRPNVVDADRCAGTLVIGEPQTGGSDTLNFPPLPGASREARTVARILLGAPAAVDGPVRSLIRGEGEYAQGANALQITNALHERPWRIVHIAGHGLPPEEGNPRGVVLSDGVFLGPREIESLRVVPELVFVNCCHLGQLSAAPGLSAPDFNRAAFAAGLAEELIRIGVRCVVAAGWAVDDLAAETFAETFYQRLAAGARFMDAVAAAREHTWRHDCNTWGAYQCYGDPDWVLTVQGEDADEITNAIQLPGIVSAPGLVLALQAVGKELALAGSDALRQRAPRERLAALVGECGARWGHQGAVAEAFALAFVAAKDDGEAIRWYTRALAAEDGMASVRAAEQRINLQIRLAWNGLPTPASPQALRAALTVVDAGIAGLRSLIAVHPTVERHSLLGSAFKRKVMIAERQRQLRGAQAALTGMSAAYEAAAALARQQALKDWYYPALNCLLADLRVDLAARRSVDDVAARAPESDPRWEALREALSTEARQAPTFWNVVGVTELLLYQALRSATLATELPEILKALADTHDRAPAAHQWGSVRDQLQFVTATMAADYPAASAVAAILQVMESYAKPGQGQ